MPGVLAGTPPSVSQFIVKLHSRCNFGCPDCYVFELRDSTWRAQPTVMSSRVMADTTRRIAEHSRTHHLPQARVMLHGGEPLLAGRRRIAEFAESLRAAWTGLDTEPRVVVQTNGSLLDTTFLEVFRRYGIRVGVSVDGDRQTHDRRRMYRSGRGSHDTVVRALNLLRGPRYEHLYAGLLCTVDLTADPVRTYEALIAHGPPVIDLLWPHGTWQHPPPGMVSGQVPYARWLSRAFDRWYDAPEREVSVRLFDSLLDVLLGGRSSSEVLGTVGADVLVIQTDGAIEQNDMLKAVHDDAARTGYDVATHTFDEALSHEGFAAARAGISGLCGTCRACPVVAVCGGGMRAHRHRPGNGFDNPSCYCADLRAFIEHVRERVDSTLLDFVDEDDGQASSGTESGEQHLTAEGGSANDALFLRQLCRGER